MPKYLILCDCEGSQEIDADALSAAGDLTCSKVHSTLCTHQLDQAAAAISAGETIIACRQEQQRFEDLAAEIGAQPPSFVDLRDRAGWSVDERSQVAKMAALIAEAQLVHPPAKSIDVVSDGVCLIVGTPDNALGAATQLAEHLSVTVLLPPDTAGSIEVPTDRRFDVVFGTLKHARGSLGKFDIEIDAFREVLPGGRGALRVSEPHDGASSVCDLIVDLSGNAPLFPAHQKRDGYLRADPKSRSAVAEVVFEASHLSGEFEKPLYVRLDEQLCAHSRAQKLGCSKCLDNCPTGAITAEGDYVSVDPAVCAGCGICSAICPSGAISYDAPPVASTFKRIETLASMYRKQAGTSPRLLVHDTEHGAELISLCARFDRGLPADVIPLEVAALSGFGHAEMLGALGAGFSTVTLLLSPNTQRQSIESEMAIAAAIAEPGALSILDASEPTQLADDLYGVEMPDLTVTPIVPLGNRRQVTRLAAKALRPQGGVIKLPDQAPYGAIGIDTEACTLCLACVSLCPSGALGDNPDSPQLKFQESACLQCGLCKSVCPESAISLQPRLKLDDEALSHQVLHEEEPFACIECGKPFGVKSTILRITEKLAGKHSMFEKSDAVRLIQMCDDCRINAQFGAESNPFAEGERPRVRTTEDYLPKRRDH